MCSHECECVQIVPRGQHWQFLTWALYNNTGIAARTVHELNEERFGLYTVRKASHDDTWWSETDDEYCSSLIYMWCDLILFLAKPFVHVRVAMPHNLNRHAVIMCHN